MHRILQQLMHAMESTVPSGGKTEEEGVPTAPGATSEADPSKFGVSFVTTRTSGAPPETSGATASPVKPYTPVSAAQSSAIKMSSVLESDRCGLLDDDSLSSDDSDYERQRSSNLSREYSPSSKWWFQQPAIRKNCCLVVVVWMLIFLGIAMIITGTILEILFHMNSMEVIRGFIFFIIAVVVLVPSVYAATHVYLAAKRVGRVRFNSVWFF